MRTAPRVAAGVLPLVVYMAIVSALWFALDVDYTQVAESPGDVIAGIVVPVGAGALLLIAYTTYLGWWQPALFERPRTAPTWTRIVTFLFLTAAVLNIAASGFVSLGPLHIAMLAAGCALVGFSEELLIRGLVLVGFRGQVSELGAWFASCLLFGLLHAINALFGAGVGDTVQQVVFAFVAGSALYVIRQAEGTLIVGMVVHALWDFGTLSVEATGATPPAVLNLLFTLTLVAGLVSVPWVTRAKARTAGGAAATAAPVP